MEKEYKHIIIVEEENLIVTDDIRGKNFAVKNKRSTVGIGYILWYSRWQQFVYHPNQGSLYSSDCLTDIVAFLEELNKTTKDILKSEAHQALLKKKKYKMHQTIKDVNANLKEKDLKDTNLTIVKKKRLKAEPVGKTGLRVSLVEELALEETKERK